MVHMMREAKDAEFNKRKIELENKDKENREKYLLKQEQKEEKLKIAKEDKEKENMIKSNKLYISTINNKLRYLREENAKEYKRNLKYENMNEKTKMIQEKKKEKNDENDERKRLEEEISKDKQIMLNRLTYIMQSGGGYTKEEVNNYVFKGIKPQKKKKENNNNHSNKDKTSEKKNKEDAFLTSLPNN
jgi:hypothetical protein